MRFTDAKKGIISGPTNGTVFNTSVTVNGIAGVVNYNQTLGGNAQGNITVNNAAVTADSQVFLQAQSTTAANVITMVLYEVSAGVFRFTVSNIIASPSGTLSFHYFIVNLL